VNRRPKKNAWPY